MITFIELGFLFEPSDLKCNHILSFSYKNNIYNGTWTEDDHVFCGIKE